MGFKQPTVPGLILAGVSAVQYRMGEHLDIIM